MKNFWKTAAIFVSSVLLGAILFCASIYEDAEKEYAENENNSSVLNWMMAYNAVRNGWLADSCRAAQYLDKSMVDIDEDLMAIFNAKKGETLEEFMERAKDIGKELGLNYVPLEDGYTCRSGNVECTYYERDMVLRMPWWECRSMGQ